MKNYTKKLIRKRGDKIKKITLNMKHIVMVLFLIAIFTSVSTANAYNIIDPQISLSISELESTPIPGSNTFTIYSKTDLTYGANITDGSTQINDKSTVNWDFGEGSKKSGISINHNYQNTGQYTLKLDVEVKDSGNTFTKSSTFTVKVVNRPDTKPSEVIPNPEVSINISNFQLLPKYGNKAAQVNLNENLVFSAFISGTYEKTAKLISVRWTFVNVTIKNGQSVNHTFKKTGWYDLKVSATSSINSNSYNSETSYRIYVAKPATPGPVISIGISNFEPPSKNGKRVAQINLKEKLSFNAFISGSLAKKAKITKVIWDFGDKTKKTGIKTSHTYKKTGGYLVQVTTTSTYKGKTYSSTNVYNISVVKKPDLSIESVKRNTDNKNNVNSLTVLIINKGSVTSKATEIKTWYSSSALKKYSKLAKVKSLKPGKAIEITIAFKIPYKFRNHVKKIKVDPDNKIDESVKNNNLRNL